MSKFSEEELIMIALILDEEEEINSKKRKRKRTLWVHDLWKKREQEVLISYSTWKNRNQHKKAGNSLEKPISPRERLVFEVDVNVCNGISPCIWGDSEFECPVYDESTENYVDCLLYKLCVLKHGFPALDEVGALL
ncbi:hypothetical protein QTP88_020930 [Uroleucon formosanum]